MQIPSISVSQLGTSTAEEKQNSKVRGKAERQLHPSLSGCHGQWHVCESGDERSKRENAGQTVECYSAGCECCIPLSLKEEFHCVEETSGCSRSRIVC